MTVIAVDTGRTRCRAAVVTGDREPAAVHTVPSGVTLVDPDGASRVAAIVTGALAALPAAGPATLVVAAAGSLSRPDAAAALADLLAGDRAGTATSEPASAVTSEPASTATSEPASAVTSEPASAVTSKRTGTVTSNRAAAGTGDRTGAITRVLVTGDVVAAHAGTFAGSAGVVLAVGTGAVALAAAPDRRPALVDGGGYLVGDAGSGFAIGRAGLAAALRHADGRPGGSAALAAAATDWFGPPREIAALSAVRVASFAPAVAAAGRAGDEVAVAIWRDAVGELADTVLAACATLPAGPRPVAVTGALAQVDDLLMGPLRKVVSDRCPQVTMSTRPGDTLVGAARLANPTTNTYDSLVVVGAPAGSASRTSSRPAGPARAGSVAGASG